MPIGSDFTLSYTNKTITHTSGTTVYEMFELYAWLMDEVDESGTIDDPIPMTAQTPTSYTLTNRWFIDETSIHYLKGGSLKTSGWDATANDGGIRVITFAGAYTNAVSTDIGKAVVYSGGSPTDSGVLLFYDNTAQKWWVRCDNTGDTFSNTSTALVITSGTGQGVISTGTNITGDNIWTNIFTLGTLVANTQVYVVRDDVRITPWWGMGHIDVLILVQEGGELIDNGYLTIYARQYTKLYDHYFADFSDGSRTPVPLAIFTDSNNPSGYRQMVLSVTNDGFVAGDLIQDDSDSTIQGVVTSYESGTNTLEYYLVGLLNDFSAATGTFASISPGTGTGTAVNPTDVGPAAVSGVTFTFGGTSENLNNGNGARPYSVIIDCNNYTLAEMYEYFKWVTRYGSTTALNGYDGEQYTAIADIQVAWDAQSSAFVEGETINGQTSGATGVLVAVHDEGTTGRIDLKEVVGTFQDNENLRSGATVRAVANIPSGADVISPVKQSPFGTYAGGTFFGARGVWLDNVPAGDANNYQLIDSYNVEQNPPQTVAITVNNTLSGDRVAVFPTTGDNEIIDKSQYTSTNANSSGNGTFVVLETIESDTPASGFIRVPIRVNGLIIGEDRYEYSSWTGSTFTLVLTLTRTYDNNDTAYVPYIDEEATGASVSQSITYVSDRFVLTVVRASGILPFKIKGQITSNGLTVQTIRTDDTVRQ